MKSPYKQLLNEHIVDAVITQDYGVNYETTYDDFKKVINEIASRNEEDTFLPNKVYLRSLIKFFRDRKNLTKEQKKDLMELVENFMKEKK